MQLNKAHKYAVIEGLVKATFKDRFDAMAEEYDAFAQRLLGAEMGADEKTLRESLPKDLIERCFYGFGRFDISVKDDQGRSDHRVCRPFLEGPGVVDDRAEGEKLVLGPRPEYRRAYRESRSSFDGSGYLQHASTGDPMLTTDHFMRKEYDDLRKRSLALIKEAQTLQDELSSVVLSARTDTRLIELIPETEAYIPKPAPKTNIVPISTIEGIRQQLRKAS